MRSVRFPSAFVVAIAAHAALALALALLPKAHVARPSSERSPQELVIVDEEVVPSPPVSAEGVAPQPQEVSPSSTPRGRLASKSPSKRAVPPPESAPEPSEVIVASPAGSAESWSFSPRAQVDLGVGEYWKSVALASSAVPEGHPAPVPEPAPTAPDRRLLETLNARDLSLGLSRGGPLVSAAHEAASLAIAPDTGSAIFDVEADEAGRVMAANIVSSNGNAPGWADVARELVSLMSSKRLRLRPGTHGLRTRLRIIAERTLPSGQQSSSFPGAVPDDIPGEDPSCEGHGMERKCLKGSPAGVTQSIGDIANIGARATRIVRAQILAETTL